MTVITPQEFHAELRKRFADHLTAVRESREEEYSFLSDEGIVYNGWLDHQHAWPVDPDGTCIPCSAPCCAGECGGAYPVEATECGTTAVLIRMYEQRIAAPASA